MNAVLLDSFSGAAADLPRHRRQPTDILRALSTSPRVSVWDMTEHAWLRTGIRHLEVAGMLREVGEPYPWLRYALTGKGVEALTADKDQG